MEKTTRRVLNETLVKLFNNIMSIEEKAVITEEYKDITNNDMHIIERSVSRSRAGCPTSQSVWT